MNGVLSNGYLADLQATIPSQFTLMDDFVRGALEAFLSDKGVQNTESVFEINYFDSNPPPEPETEVNHDDWVSGVAARGQFVLTACYDNTISIFRSGLGFICMKD